MGGALSHSGTVMCELKDSLMLPDSAQLLTGEFILLQEAKDVNW